MVKPTRRRPVGERALQSAFVSAARRARLDPVVMQPAPYGYPDVCTTRGLVELKHAYIKQSSNDAATVPVRSIKRHQRAFWLRRSNYGGDMFVLLGLTKGKERRAFLLRGGFAAKNLGRCSPVEIAAASMLHVPTWGAQDMGAICEAIRSQREGPIV